MYNIPVGVDHLCAGPILSGGKGTCVVSLNRFAKYNILFNIDITIKLTENSHLSLLLMKMGMVILNESASVSKKNSTLIFFRLDQDR